MISALILAAALAGAHGPCYSLRSDARYDVMNDHEILVSAGLHAYRILLTPNAALNDPSTNLVVQRAGVVCSPIELQLSAVGPSIGRTGLIVRSISALSPAQAAELRKGRSKHSELRR